MLVKVKTFTRVLELEADPDEKVKLLRDRVRAEGGDPPGGGCTGVRGLIFAGKLLKNGHKLGDQGVTEGSTIFVRGGGIRGDGSFPVRVEGGGYAALRCRSTPRTLSGR
jgi:hypothetical protein